MSLTLKVIRIDNLEVGNTVLIGRRIYDVINIDKDSFGYQLKLRDLNGNFKTHFANFDETITIEL
jgi:hypothetical protein